MSVTDTSERSQSEPAIRNFVLQSMKKCFFLAMWGFFCLFVFYCSALRPLMSSIHVSILYRFALSLGSLCVVIVNVVTLQLFSAISLVQSWWCFSAQARKRSSLFHFVLKYHSLGLIQKTPSCLKLHADPTFFFFVAEPRCQQCEVRWKPWPRAPFRDWSILLMSLSFTKSCCSSGNLPKLLMHFFFSVQLLDFFFLLCP